MIQFAALFAALISTHDSMSDGFRITEIAPDTWQVCDTDAWQANCLVACMPDGTIVLADTPASGPATERLIGWMDSTFADRDALSVVVVVSHAHADACAGIHELLQTRDRGWTVQVWSTARCAELIEQRGRVIVESPASSLDRASAFRADLLSTTIVAPTHTFTVRHQFELAGEIVSAIDLGHAHDEGNAAVWFPDRGVLFGSCAVLNINASRPGFVGNANLQRWQSAVRDLMELRPSIVIPGHGAAGGAELLTHTEVAVEREAIRRNTAVPD